ncbi:MAG: prepilin-type N-terminal cleavage/methylation domain-containing protein, partial [Myxococcota bacterium]
MQNVSTNPRARRPRRKVRGLTLIEILVVVTILGLIAGIV